MVAPVLPITEYHIIVGFTMYWQNIMPDAFDRAILASKTKLPKGDIESALFAAGYEFNKKGKLKYKL